MCDSVGLTKNLHVIYVVEKVIELLSVARKLISHLRARIVTGLATLLKTVSSRGVTKLSKRKMLDSPRTVGPRNQRSWAIGAEQHNVREGR